MCSKVIEQNAKGLKSFDIDRRPPRAVLRYPGGKARILNSITEFLPKHINEYREPFLGGGSLFLWLLYTRPGTRFWINDINQDLMAFWSTLKISGERLAQEASEMREKYSDGRELYYKLKSQRVDELEIFERGLRFFILNRITYSGLVDAGGYSKASFYKRFTENSIENLRHVSPRLKNVKITSENYSSLLKAPGKEVFLFVDPPYETVKYKKLYGKGGVNGINFDKDILLADLKECKHNWLLTYDKTDAVYNSYAQFALVDEKLVQYGTNFRNNGGENKKPAKKGLELFIHNYKVEQVNHSLFKEM
jgi:DNA adenine methylase